MKPPRAQSLLRSSAVFAALTLVSRFMGLARDLVITARMGASATLAADAYYTALQFPNLFRRIFAEGAFAAAFVPAYSRTLGADDAEAADRFAGDALASVAAVTVALSVVAMLAMPWLMYLINPGYADEPEKFRLAVVLTQITMLYLPCMAIAALFAGVLNARGRFIVSAAYPTVLNAVMLLAVWPQVDPIRAAYAASWAVLVAGVGQFALVWWAAAKSGARIRPWRLRLTPEVRALVRLAIPAAIANSATQVNIVVSGIIASQVAGARAWLNVADRLYQLPMSLVGVAIGVALLPRLSRSVGAGDHADAAEAMDQAIVFALALSLPAAAALVAMPGFLIDGLFTRGAFTAEDARATGSLLLHYGWGVPAFVLIRVLTPAFFARSDTRGPMRFALTSVAVNIALGVALFLWIGIDGLPIATSAAAWLNVVQMTAALWRAKTWRPGPRVIARALSIAAASAAMGAMLAAAAWRQEDLARWLLGKEIAVLLVAAAGGLLYAVLLVAFRGVTLGEIRIALRRRPAAEGEVQPTPSLD